MLRQVYLIGLIFCLVSLVRPAHAVQPDEVLDDSGLEQRARDISLELRCLVCQNQSIDDSDAPLAKDLRVLVRDRLTSGDTDAQVIDFVVARYGEFVLLRPRFAGHTLVLWLAPPLLLVFGMMGVFLFYRRRPTVSGDADVKRLSAREKRELDRLLKKT